MFLLVSKILLRIPNSLRSRSYLSIRIDWSIPYGNITSIPGVEHISEVGGSLRTYLLASKESWFNILSRVGSFFNKLV